MRERKNRWSNRVPRMTSPVFTQFTSGLIFYSWPASVYLWHTHSGVVVFYYLCIGQKDTRLCPYCYGSILGLSYSCHLTLSPRDPTSPPPPPPSSHISGSSPLLIPLYPKRPDPPPARSCAIVLSPSLFAPPSPFGAGARLGRTQVNACLAAPDSA